MKRFTAWLPMLFPSPRLSLTGGTSGFQHQDVKHDKRRGERHCFCFTGIVWNGEARPGKGGTRTAELGKITQNEQINPPGGSGASGHVPGKDGDIGIKSKVGCCLVPVGS